MMELRKNVRGGAWWMMIRVSLLKSDESLDQAVHDDGSIGFDGVGLMRRGCYSCHYEIDDADGMATGPESSCDDPRGKGNVCYHARNDGN